MWSLTASLRELKRTRKVGCPSACPDADEGARFYQLSWHLESVADFGYVGPPPRLMRAMLATLT